MSLSAQIAIDIGTTYSRVAVFQHGGPLVLKNELANNLTPSYVAYTENLCHVGDQAKEISATSGTDAIYGARRILGRKGDDPFVKQTILDQNCKFVPIDGRPSLQVNYRKEAKTVTPEEVMALLIRKMVKIGNKELLGRKKAIITVPTQFDCYQRKAVKNAAFIAGIDCELINETTAAAIACTFEMNSEFTRQKRNLLVYNMGGGFTTATIVSVTNDELCVLSTAGDMQLGGEDFDQALVDHCCKQFEENHEKIGLSENQSAMCKLKQACEKAKRSLSFSVRSTIRVEDLFAGNDFNTDITREVFETRLCGDLFERAMDPVIKVLSYARMKKDQIAEIILVGGSTRMPIIKQKLMMLFPQRRVNSSVNQDEAAVLGAAIRAGTLTKFQDVIPAPFLLNKTNGEAELSCLRNNRFPCKYYRNYKVEDFVLNPRSSNVKLTVFYNRDAITHSWPKRSIGNIVTLGFIVDADGIPTVEIHVTGKRYQLFPSQKGSLTEEGNRKISQEIARYSKHKADDSERITAKDMKDLLERGVVKLSVKLSTEKLSDTENMDYSDLRDTLSKWLTVNATATVAEYENILDEFYRRVDEIKQKHALEKLPVVANPTAPIATNLGATEPSTKEIKVQPGQGDQSSHQNSLDKKILPSGFQNERPTHAPAIEDSFGDMKLVPQEISTNPMDPRGCGQNVVAEFPHPSPTPPINAVTPQNVPSNVNGSRPFDRSFQPEPRTSDRVQNTSVTPNVFRAFSPANSTASQGSPHG